MSFNWTCPHCQTVQTVTDDKYKIEVTPFDISGLAEGWLGSMRQGVGCSNPDCKKLTVFIRIGKITSSSGGGYTIKLDDAVYDQMIVPAADTKPQPDFIPEPLREDYYEACLVKNLSPKASATLTRRCLQGIIRDFCGIKGNTLFAEIDTLKAAVEDGSANRAISVETVEAIDHVRGIGNIGAHMEKDISKIVPVDPGEAQALIELVEMLFDEWYGAREARRQKLARIAAISEEKKKLRAETPAAPLVAALAADEQADASDPAQ